MTLVVDASVVFAALVENGSTGDWARALLQAEELAAPHVMLAEVANSLRLAALRRFLSPDAATSGYLDLISLTTNLHAFEPFAARIWELRENITPYDAWYVAIAESLGAPLVTVDNRLRRASGPRCRFITPET